MIDFLGAAAAFAVGLLISALNYLISKYVLKHHADKFSIVGALRQVIQVAFIVALYFISDYMPFNKWYILIGGVLGITIPMFYFTFKLIKTNKEGDK